MVSARLGSALRFIQGKLLKPVFSFLFWLGFLNGPAEDVSACACAGVNEILGWFWEIQENIGMKMKNMWKLIEDSVRTGRRKHLKLFPSNKEGTTPRD